MQLNWRRTLGINSDPARSTTAAALMSENVAIQHDFQIFSKSSLSEMKKQLHGTRFRTSHNCLVTFNEAESVSRDHRNGKQFRRMALQTRVTNGMSYRLDGSRSNIVLKMAPIHPASLDDYWFELLSRCNFGCYRSSVRVLAALRTLRESLHLRDPSGNLRHTSFHDSALLDHTYCVRRGYWFVVGFHGNRVSTAPTVPCNGQEAGDV